MQQPQQQMPFQPFQVAQTRPQPGIESDAGLGAPQPKAAAPTPTPAQKEVDKKYAEEYVDWRVRGSYADIDKQLKQLEDAALKLESGDNNLTGPFIGLMPDEALAFFAPDAISNRERVEEVVQRSLKQILGAQFTEKEGERIIARSYNKKLQESDNVRRVRALLAQIKAASDAKEAAAQYFDKHGTLAGFRGPVLPASLDDAAPSQSEAPEEPDEEKIPPAPDGADPEDWKFMTPEERAAWLGN
jgi:hypothetical protein